MKFESKQMTGTQGQHSLGVQAGPDGTFCLQEFDFHLNQAQQWAANISKSGRGTWTTVMMTEYSCHHPLLVGRTTYSKRGAKFTELTKRGNPRNHATGGRFFDPSILKDISLTEPNGRETN